LFGQEGELWEESSQPRNQSQKSHFLLKQAAIAAEAPLQDIFSISNPQKQMESQTPTRKVAAPLPFPNITWYWITLQIQELQSHYKHEYK
jgi:hypothetical protein